MIKVEINLQWLYVNTLVKFWLWIVFWILFSHENLNSSQCFLLYNPYINKLYKFNLDQIVLLSFSNSKQNNTRNRFVQTICSIYLNLTNTYYCSIEKIIKLLDDNKNIQLWHSLTYTQLLIWIINKIKLHRIRTKRANSFLQIPHRFSRIFSINIHNICNLMRLNFYQSRAIYNPPT